VDQGPHFATDFSSSSVPRVKSISVEDGNKASWQFTDQTTDGKPYQNSFGDLLLGYEG
jgi:hypothetical protein